MKAVKRIRVTLPAVLVERIDRMTSDRSRFIAQAIAREIASRRRESLQQSIASPHAETRAFRDATVADWVADLPGETLVDPATGTPVLWIEGRGWTVDKA